ncbi:MAG: M56 family metallopeptidase [Acidobacteriota bacterium]
MQAINNWFMFVLVNSVWQMTAIVLVALACDRLLRGTRAGFRHVLWVTTLVLCFGLPVFSSIDLGRLRSSKGEPVIPAPGQLAGTESKVAEIVTAPELNASWKSLAVSEPIVIVLFAAYLMLMGYRSIKLLAAFRRARSIRRDSFANDWNESEAKLIEDCKSTFRVGDVEIFCSASVSSPITIGAVRPVIVLPEHLVHEADGSILISALGHELNHVRRRDYLKNLLYELIYLPISFHPAAALVKRRIRETRELVCDEYVTETMVEPAVYARSLVSIAGMAMDLGRTASITIGILDDDVLEKRIMKILNRPKITAARRNFVLGAATLAFVLAIVAALSFSFRPVVAQQKETPDREAAIKREVQIDEALRKAKQEAERRELSEGNGDSAGVGVSRRGREEEIVAKRLAERDAEVMNQVDLETPKIKLSMADAIKIATDEQPGTVVESFLVFEKNGGEESEPFYIVKIMFDQNDKKAQKRIIVSAIDGKTGGPHNN